ncbi:pilus assembly protein TadG-related protein [Pararhodobacter oceanensis]|uniref:pilus assembly protein TadG-related protein n=1 Tax=Pararhodobacter oceanensis TaxID=2172121 RepID=UPI003A92DD5C
MWPETSKHKYGTQVFFGRSARFSRVLRRFQTDQSGSMAVFAVFVFFAMLLMGGLAVDMMRHENERIRMQNTADRAVLAATMLRENVSEATPEQIVNSYFAAEGLTAQLDNRVIVEGDAESGRSVTVVPAGSVPTLFMHMLGIDEFDMATPARATEALAGQAQIELVMVLDVSGSMGSSNKIGTMRNAANDLATSLLTDNEDGDVAITIVPYDSWVLPPTGFLNSFSNVTGSGACNDWAVWNVITDSLNLATHRQSCDNSLWAQVRPFQNTVAATTSAINGLTSRGVTSIDLGVRYGALFFDPAIRPAISALVDSGDVDPMFAERPYGWNESNVVRALVLLTDGQNCCGSRYSTLVQDANTLAVCTELKARGVLVYSIAFQAPTAGATLMQGCASSPSHYFNASTSELIAVFQGIASNIQTQALRLTL